MEMKKVWSIAGILLVGLLMLGLVAGAGYTVSVPSVSPGGESNTPGGGGGASPTTSVSNDTATSTGDDNETATDDEDDGGVVSEGIGSVAKFVKSIGWRSVVLVLVSLGVITGVVWYFLVDKRKKFVEIRVKDKKK